MHTTLGTVRGAREAGHKRPHAVRPRGCDTSGRDTCTETRAGRGRRELLGLGTGGGWDDNGVGPLPWRCTRPQSVVVVHNRAKMLKGTVRTRRVGDFVYITFVSMKLLAKPQPAEPDLLRPRPPRSRKVDPGCAHTPRCQLCDAGERSSLGSHCDHRQMSPRSAARRRLTLSVPTPWPGVLADEPLPRAPGPSPRALSPPAVSPPRPRRIGKVTVTAHPPPSTAGLARRGLPAGSPPRAVVPLVAKETSATVHNLSKVPRCQWPAAG